MTENRRDIFESLLDDIISDVNDSQLDAARKMAADAETIDYSSPEECNAPFALQFRVNRLSKSRKPWSAFREKFRKFDEEMQYAFGQIRYIKLDGSFVYIINNEKLVDNWDRKGVHNEYYQIDDMWFFGEKSLYLPNGYTNESIWTTIANHASAFDTYIPCKFNIPPKRLPKFIAAAFNMTNSLAKKIFGEGQCVEIKFINTEIVKSRRGLGAVRIVSQTVNDIDNRNKKSNVIDTLQRLHQLIYGSIYQLDINDYLDKSEYSAYSLMILHHFNLNVKDVIMSETEECTFITIPYDKSIRFTRADIDFLYDKNRLLNKRVIFEITGTMETRTEYLSDRYEWYKFAIGYKKRWEDFLEWCIAPNVNVWNAEFYECDQEYKINLSKFYVNKMKVSFTGNSSNKLKKADKTAELIFDREPHELKIFNYQKNP